MIDSVSPRIKDVFGTMAYAPAVIEQFIKYAPARFRLIFNENSVYETQAFAVIAANCGTYAYNFKIAPSATFDDGLLDIIVWEAGSGNTLRLIGQALDTVFQQLSSNPATSYFRASAVRIESDPPVKMQIDGDVCGESGVNIEVFPRSLNLIVP